jgi:hypothetical protein
MVRLQRTEHRRLKRALQKERNPLMRQRIQMVMLRETGMIQPEIADVTGVSLSTVNRGNTLTYWKSIENGARGVILTNFCRDFLVAPEKFVSLPRGSRVVCQNGRSGSFLHDNSS